MQTPKSSLTPCLFVFNILAFTGLTLSMIFGMARDLYLVYGSFGPPIGNDTITC